MVRELPPELAKVAKTQLNEDPKRLEEDLKHLKDWFGKQPHLIARTDDQWLVAILRGCKFSLERAKKKLDLYYTLKTIAPDITLRMRPTESKFLDFLRLGTCVILPIRKNDKLIPRTIVIRPGRYNTQTHNVTDVMCILHYLVQILVVEDDIATIIGTKIVVDYKGVTMAHLAEANPVLLKKIVAVSQDSLPLRLKGSHHMNVPSGIEVIFKLVKGLLNEKAKERLVIHKNYNELLDHLPSEMVPEEYGGTGGTMDEISEYWCRKIVEYKSWMELEETLGTTKTVADVIGVEGSFRKLDID